MGNNVSDLILKTDIQNVTGNIKRYEFTWLLDGFCSSKLGAGTCVSSQKFASEIGNEKDWWQILLYPDGFNHRVDGFVSLWLKKFSDNEKLVTFSCAILNSEFKQLIKKTTHRKLALESAVGWTTFCKRSLIEADKTVLRNGNLKLVFTLDIFSNEDVLNPAVEDYDPNQRLRSHDVCDSMKQLLDDGTFSDLTIAVDSHEFHVHKAILSARSDVFLKLLTPRFRESSINQIEIEDVSKDGVQEMLHFIYTGRLVDEVTEEVLCELFYAAEKYELWLLKKVCSIIAANNLNNDNVLRILSVANQHNSLKLKDMCLRYISGNTLEIQKQRGWYDLMMHHPEMVNTIVESLSKRDDDSP
ncbi:TD and POZ domain-containing protein 2 [Araneus ventricosus]|uniref:TD and POZ domain-containing protein 2 n=1 Tax=Araneus ventricosus TaxID=182803 RepID=A0A4Y2BQF7_ARAVE|nr:TD and POZ domain-containing protein 2 [Araneus ventricosus]